jgi:two-component system cell cycle sensor histidine kinase/response regulator CckA
MDPDLPDDPKLRLYRFVFEHARDPIIVLDGDGRTLLLNRAARQLPDELIERLFGDVASQPSELALLRRRVAAQGHARTEISAGGRSFEIEGRAHDGQHVLTVCDRTQQRAFENELRALQRIESIGHFTAGLAHDFNNLLTPITCLSSCLEAELPPGGGAREMARDIRTAAELAAGIARQTLRLVRREPRPVEVVRVNAVVEELETLVQRVAGKDVRVELALGTQAGTATLERERLEHALINLVANARDAMPFGGRLTVATEKVSFDAVEANSIEGETMTARAPAHAYVCVRVSDTGIGMSRAVRERVFERFFTTKEPGSGTGLGLAGVRRFVAESDGCIALRSEPGSGTTVALYFPSVEAPLHGEFASVEPAVRDEPSSPGA